MEKQYIVGIDFGHGETSAWVVPLNLTTDAIIGESLKLKATNKESETVNSGENNVADDTSESP